jgi:hypothetical protein
MALSAQERETVIVVNDGEGVASVHTWQRRIITQLKKNPAARLVDEGRFEGSAWAKFELPKNFISFRSKTRSLSDEEKSRRAAQLRRGNSSPVLVGNADSVRGN